MKFLILFACVIACAVCAPTSGGDKKKEFVPIVKWLENHDEFGQYTSEYLSGDRTTVKEKGTLVDGPKGKVLIKSGSFSYYGEDGKLYEVVYVADRNGFKATGAHLPKEPKPVHPNH